MAILKVGKFKYYCKIIKINGLHKETKQAVVRGSALACEYKRPIFYNLKTLTKVKLNNSVHYY